LGVLLKARQLGYLEAVRAYVDQMQQGGIRLSAALVQRVLELAGEAE
jgi:predicted nucleic acid-binding protein